MLCGVAWHNRCSTASLGLLDQSEGSLSSSISKALLECINDGNSDDLRVQIVVSCCQRKRLTRGYSGGDSRYSAARRDRSGCRWRLNARRRATYLHAPEIVVAILQPQTPLSIELLLYPSTVRRAIYVKVRGPILKVSIGPPSKTIKQCFRKYQKPFSRNRRKHPS